jgi:nucleotide-binding universal stress UspA family protein
MEALRTNTGLSLSKILVATDFSQVSKTALAYATALANQYEARILVAHALIPEPQLSVASGFAARPGRSRLAGS